MKIGGPPGLSAVTLLGTPLALAVDILSLEDTVDILHLERPGNNKGEHGGGDPRASATQEIEPFTPPSQAYLVEDGFLMPVLS